MILGIGLGSQYQCAVLAIQHDFGLYAIYEKRYAKIIKKKNCEIEIEGTLWNYEMGKNGH